jgi:hypothetical protein
MAELVAFPAPVIRQSVVHRVQVLVTPQDLIERNVLESASGKCYELGRTLKYCISTFYSLYNAYLVTCHVGRQSMVMFVML